MDKGQIYKKDITHDSARKLLHDFDKLQNNYRALKFEMFDSDHHLHTQSMDSTLESIKKRIKKIQNTLDEINDEKNN